MEQVCRVELLKRLNFAVPEGKRNFANHRLNVDPAPMTYPLERSQHRFIEVRQWEVVTGFSTI